MRGARSGAILSALSATLLIATFNLGGWYLVWLATDNLEQEFSRRLTATGRATVAGLNRQHIERLERESSRALVSAQLQEIREQTGMSELFLFDRHTRVVADSYPRRAPWTASYVRLEQSLLDSAWKGKPSVTAVRYVEGVPFLDAFLPVPDLSGDVRYLLAVEDSPTRLQVFHSYQQALWGVSLASALVIILLTVTQVTVFRSLLEARRRAAQGERLSSMGRIGATVAHELRNPLTSLSATVQVVLRRYRKSGKIDEELLEGIPKEVDRVNGLITDFLAFSRDRSISLAPLVPRDFIKNALTAFAPDESIEGVPIQLHFGNRIPASVQADGDKLMQVVQNLLNNAAQAVKLADKEGGTVRVRVHHARLGARPAWRFSIEDDGPGVPEHEQEKIFDPYFTSKAQGTGLGLAVVQKIVDAHGGDVRCEGAPGAGALFSVTLPVSSS